MNHEKFELTEKESNVLSRYTLKHKRLDDKIEFYFGNSELPVVGVFTSVVIYLNGEMVVGSWGKVREQALYNCIPNLRNFLYKRGRLGGYTKKGRSKKTKPKPKIVNKTKPKPKMTEEELDDFVSLDDYYKNIERDSSDCESGGVIYKKNIHDYDRTGSDYGSV